MKNTKVTSFVIGGFFVVIAMISFLAIQYQAKSYLSTFVADDIAKLAAIFQKINDDAKIISFDRQQNTINFLTVASVEGPEIGPIEVAYPDKWEGPYLRDELALEGKEYMVVRTNEGYFITPGEGVKLTNGKVVGTDIILNEHANIAAMMQDEDALSYKGRPLAAPLQTTSEGVLIADHITRLAAIFERIDETCKIVSFDAQKNPINFLTTRSFTGSELGGMNVRYGDKWEGAYARQEFKIQGKDYMVVNTKLGYFITPGEGVRLPNGKVIGKDIVLDQKTDINALVRDEKALMFQGKPLAHKLEIKTSFLDQVIQENIVRPEEGGLV